LAARDVKTAKKAAWITALVVAPFGILTALLGMAARVKFPELVNAKLALPTLMMHLSSVLGGIVLSSILAEILSTVSPIILACGTMVTKDIYQRRLKTNADDREILRVSRIVTGLAGLICMGIAILMYGNTRILDIVYFDVLRNSNPLRYRNERAVIRTALKRNLPLLGICRGYQVLNVEAGGTMKDGDVNLNNSINHQQGGTIPPERPSHRLTISRGTRLYRMLNTEQVMVNSFHRQALGKIPANFKVSAVADDGNIEAIEAVGKRVAVGLQFHPEMLRDEVWSRFFVEFIRLIKTG
jgi:gamma-glutamyl-gamma-aminobutyrate hydrolase PuuD